MSVFFHNFSFFFQSLPVTDALFMFLHSYIDSDVFLGRNFIELLVYSCYFPLHVVFKRYMAGQFGCSHLGHEAIRQVSACITFIKPNFNASFSSKGLSVQLIINLLQWLRSARAGITTTTSFLGTTRPQN